MRRFFVLYTPNVDHCLPSQEKQSEEQKKEKSLFFASVGALSIIKVVMIFFVCVCMIKNYALSSEHGGKKGKCTYIATYITHIPKRR